MNSRRIFLQASLTTTLGASTVLSTATGFAQAVTPPPELQPIHTTGEGLDAGFITLKNDHTEVRAYHAQKKSNQKLPIVVVVSEIFGVHEHIGDICRRLAHAGYLAIAPEIFTRWGDPKIMPNIQDIMSQVISKAEDRLILSDLDACQTWAIQNGGDANRVMITGFCFGGRITWLYAAHNAKVKAAVAWYGRLEGTISDKTPQHPIDLATQLHAPVLGLYGGADTGIPQTSVENMRAALAKGTSASKASQITVFPNAPHAFNADYRPSYQKEAAQVAWAAMLAWFERYGK